MGEKCKIFQYFCFHLAEDLYLVIVVFFDVVGVVHDHLHQAGQRNLVQVSQQNCLNYLEKRFLAFVELALEDALHLFRPDLGREVMHPHEIQYAEQALVLVMLNTHNLLQQSVL